VDDLVAGQVYLDVAVVSPQRRIYEGEAHWVTLTGIDGQFGVWPRHVAMVAALGSGPLRIGLPNQQRAEFVARGGFLSVADNVVTILVDQALTKDEVDPEVARRELEEANAALQHPSSDREFIRLLDRRDWATACLKIAGATANHQ
jgi:F-type H+-transporting ATPase subunit epsilon